MSAGLGRGHLINLWDPELLVGLLFPVTGGREDSEGGEDNRKEGGRSLEQRTSVHEGQPWTGLLAGFLGLWGSIQVMVC